MSDTTPGEKQGRVTPIGIGNNPPTTADQEWPSAAAEIGRPIDHQLPSGDYDPVSDSRTVVDATRGKPIQLETEGEVWVAEEPITDEPARPKARALTQAERAAQEAEAERIRLEAERDRLDLEREVKAERLRFREIDPLRAAVFITALVIGVVIFLTSGLFSYAAIAAAAEWMRPEWSWLVLLVPGFVEAFLVFFGIDGIVYQAKAVYARTEKQQAYYRKQARSATVWMFVFATVAVVGNGAHTLFRWLEDGATIPWFGFVGIVMSALAPLSVVLITKRISRLVFVYAVEE